MNVLLLTTYFLIVFLVIYTESRLVIPTMKPDDEIIFLLNGQKLVIECSSTRKIKFFYKPINKTVFDLSKINSFSEKKENGIYTMKIQINETYYYDTGLFGCGHNKREDRDVRWISVEIGSLFRNQYQEHTLDYVSIQENPRKLYIEVKKNDSFQITCNNTGKMIIRRYISPWLCCILPIEDEPNETDTIMIFQKDKKKIKTRGIFDCDYCEQYRDNFINAKTSQYKINETFILSLEKNKAVLGDTGWYGCDLENRKGSETFWTYVYVKPEKYLFVDINDFKAINVDVNKTLTIPCRPKSPNYQVTLYANKTKINDNDNVIFNNSIGFIIENVQLKDNGYYECRITLDGITEEKGFDVLVTEPNNLKPTMYPDLSYIELEENQMLNLTCTHTQEVLFLYNPWMFLQNMVCLTEKTHTKVNGIHTLKLQVKISPEHIGFYGCGNAMISNLNTRWIYVYVKAKPKIRKLRINKYYEPEEKAEIQNTVEAFPSSNIRSTLEESNSHLEILTMTNIFSYIVNRQFIVTTVDSLSWTPARNITFTVHNDFGNDSIVVPLFLDGKPPEFGISGPNKKLVVGDPLELKCTGSLMNSLDRMIWTNNNDSEITLSDADPRMNIRLLEYDEICISILTISSVKKSDEYEYYCKIENTIYNYMLNVNELKKPNCSRTNMNKNEAKYETRGKLSVLTCYVDGVPEPIITWSIDDVQINTTYSNMPNDICKYDFSNNNQELQIGYLDESCFGNYSCKADNNLGHWETYQQIIIDDPTIRNIVAFGVTSALIITTIILIYFFFKYQKEKNLRKQLIEGDSQPLNPELPVNEQVDLLGYNKKWEFSRDKLKFGIELGCGQFGIVKKAEAHGIYGGDDKTITTVAVKMANEPTKITNIQALANELKIMAYIGKNDNIVNLLGACTKNITKHELLVIVEYCHFGDLHNYLIKHRREFINQIDPISDKINIYVDYKIPTTLASLEKKNNEYRIKYSQPLFPQRLSSSDQDSLKLSADVDALNNNSAQPNFQSNNQRDNYNRDKNFRKVFTQDLFLWSLQVAKGMEYLSHKKVLHGDLAARNILLAENNIAKISDFGLAKNICSNGIYKKKGNAPLPVRWMAIDSLKNRKFTTQSDVWSFGIVLWEFFSLAKTPYAGMDLDEYCSKVFEGYRMEKPEYATNEIYNIMFKCWLEDPTLRPTFTDLVNDIGDLLDNIDKKDSTDLNTPYVDIKNRLDDDANNNYLIINPAPNHPTLSSSSKSDHVNEPTININTNSSYVCEFNK